MPMVTFGDGTVIDGAMQKLVEAVFFHSCNIPAVYERATNSMMQSWLYQEQAQLSLHSHQDACWEAI